MHAHSCRVTPANSRPRSIRMLLSGAALLFLLLIVGLGIFSIERLRDVNRVSDEIRSRWLQDVGLIGDLNNYMSDYRTAESTHLLSRTRAEEAATERDLLQLRSRVAHAQNAYESLAHDAAELGIYDAFATQWRAYQEIAARVLAASRSGDKPLAVTMYMNQSHAAFETASDTLGRLTEQTVTKARAAGGRAFSAYMRDERLIISAMILATGLVLVTLLYITRSVSHPMRQLARVMHALAAHDLEADVPQIHRDDEIGEMARSVAVFREDAIALASSRRRLLEQTAALEEALESERRLTAQQRNFVTLTSHEFRTPLTVIDAQAQRLIKLKERLSPTDVQERAGRIRLAVTRLTGIMDSLLGASRLLDGHAVFDPGDFDPGALLREVCQLHRETNRNAHIHEDLQGLPPSMGGDPKLLFALFSNLLSNAVKYSPPGSPIELVARVRAPDWLQVEVRDHGIGIPAADRASLFERYFRGSNAVGVTGSGVGLHLVAMVLQLHGGTILVNSSEGNGSTFQVQLPLRRAHEPASGGSVPPPSAGDGAAIAPRIPSRPSVAPPPGVGQTN